MKETVLKSKQEQDKLQGARSKLQFELSEQQRLAAELGRELTSVTEQLEAERQVNVDIREGDSDALEVCIMTIYSAAGSLSLSFSSELSVFILRSSNILHKMLLTRNL